VGHVDVENFVGTLVGKHAHEGVFITTSDFQRNALGVSTVRSIALKRVDSDYFTTSSGDVPA
jgi:restriction endonuclease Mrr